MTNLSLREADFTYENFQRALVKIQSFTNEFDYDADKCVSKAEIDWVIPNIAIPNTLIVLQGYGLYTRRELLRMNFEKAKLSSSLPREVVATLESKYKEAELEFNNFLSKSYWVD